jgi:hypothetical protein
VRNNGTLCYYLSKYFSLKVARGPARALPAARIFSVGRPVNITEEILLTTERKTPKVMLSAVPSVLIMSFSWGYTPTYVVVETLDTGRNLLS